MDRSRGKRYLQGILWFTTLWSVKEFIIEPLLKNLKEKHNGKKQIKGS